MFKDFGKKLQRGVKRIVDSRLKATEQLSGGNLKCCEYFLCFQYSHLSPYVFYSRSFTKFVTPRRTMTNTALVFVDTILCLEPCLELNASNLSLLYFFNCTSLEPHSVYNC
ncbi:ACTR3B [Bugula neritina]|uniref:ACTR3B n=1 Tax=Bugula neritina TaxID=10212 RepID=A0A7J7JHH1_BUGNE|nr:ACTR3B [Bugula neritina]